MIEDELAAKIREYQPANSLEQESVLQELLQHYVLASLSKAGFFSLAAFHGDTCLRIFHRLRRFSEDLDFVLKKPDKNFAWSKYLNRVRDDCAAEGMTFEVTDRAKAGVNVKKAFLKTDSIGKVIVLQLPHSRNPSRKIRIKVEVDTNPPATATYETQFLTFPLPVAVTTMTLESAFASKSHALLCRKYTKGRDWYDFLWSASRSTKPNLGLLENALRQQGPWAGTELSLTWTWYLENMEARIEAIDWQAAREDIRRFLALGEQEALELWGKEFFLCQLEKLERTLGPG